MWTGELGGPERVKGGLHMYLIDRIALVYLGEICALDDESGSGYSAAQICSMRVLPVSTHSSLSG